MVGTCVSRPALWPMHEEVVQSTPHSALAAQTAQIKLTKTNSSSVIIVIIIIIIIIPLHDWGINGG